jgi:hypothetical protein
MRARRPIVLVACAALLVSLSDTGSLLAQRSESAPRDLSGRWQLNTDLSENAEAKLEAMHSGEGGGHGPGRHFGGLFGSAPSAAQMEEVLLLKAPAWFVVRQDGERIVLTDNDGRVRILTANGRRERVNGREVRTKWEQDRLVSEISVDHAKVIETYQRATNARQLIVTTKLDMRGRDVSVRRVYELGTPQ